MDCFNNFRTNEKMMHLSHTTAFLLILMMLGMLVIDVAILKASLFDKSDALEVMMMKHNGRQQHGTCRYPKAIYI